MPGTLGYWRILGPGVGCIRPRYRLRANLQKKGNKSQNGNRCTREPNRLARVIGLDSEEISLFSHIPFAPPRKRTRDARDARFRSLFAFLLCSALTSFIITCVLRVLTTCAGNDTLGATKLNVVQRTRRYVRAYVCVYDGTTSFVSFLSRASSYFPTSFHVSRSRVIGVVVSHWYIGQGARETGRVRSDLQRASPSKPDCTPSD